MSFLDNEPLSVFDAPDLSFPGWLKYDYEQFHWSDKASHIYPYWKDPQLLIQQSPFP